MSDTETRLEEAEAQLAAGRETRALEILRGVLESTDDPAVIQDVHALAETAHEASKGFHKIEWQRLVFDAEARTKTPAAG